MQKSINELLNLDKPLVIFDLETTGLSINIDKIIEIAYMKIMPGGVIKKNDIFINPEMEIAEEATVVHGIKNESLIDKPIFREKAQELWDVFSNCYYGGFNILNFDLPLLKREFIRIGMDFNFSESDIVDSKVIYHYMEPRTLSAAYKYYCKKEHVDAHNALADVEVTMEILNGQLVKYDEIRDWNFIRKIHHSSDERYIDNNKKFYWRSGEAYFNFSKHKDISLREVAKVDIGFLRWMLAADFSDEVKNIIKKAIEGDLPQKNK